MIETSILILIIPFLGTTLGSAMVFFLKKEIKPFVKKILVGFAAETDNMEEYLRNSAFPEKIRRNVEALTREDEMAEFMFLGLRMTEGVSLRGFEEYFGENMENIYGEVLKKHRNLGLLEQKNGRIFLTRRGIHVSNGVMADFLL